MDGIEATVTGRPSVLITDDRGERAGTDDADDPPAPLEPLDLERWERLATGVLVHEQVGAMEVSVTFVDAAAIADLKREHLDGDGSPTDVLAFPLDAPGAHPDDPGVPMVLGDVVICPSVAAAQAPDHAGSFDDELALLLVHGLLHLLGMDHADDADRLAMQRRERQLLAELHGPLAADPWRSVEP